MGWVSRLAAAFTRRAASPALADEAVTASAGENFPSGLGMFVRWPRPKGRIIGGTLLVLVERQGKAPRREALRGLLAGRRTIPWAFLQPGGAMAAVPVLVESARACKERWVCIDVEGPEWAPRRHAADLKPAITALHAAGLLVAVTSYGRPWTMAGWAPCLRCDAGLVQLARTGASAQALIDDWRLRFPVLGTVPQPAMAAKAGGDPAALVDDLAPRAGFMAPWVLDWYASRPQATAALVTAARTIPA